MLAHAEITNPVRAFPVLDVGERTARRANGLLELFSGQSLRRLDSDEHLFFESDCNRNVYRIESGIVALYRILGNGRRQIIALRFSGDVVGLETAGTRHCGAVAISPVTSRSVAHSVLDRLMKRSPHAAAEVIDLIGDELEATRQQIALLNRRSALEKVAAFIVELDRREPTQSGRQGSVSLKMSRTDIADFLGLTIETVSRNLTKLRVRKIIALPDIHTLVIVDRTKLLELADGDVDLE